MNRDKKHMFEMSFELWGENAQMETANSNALRTW